MVGLSRSFAQLESQLPEGCVLRGVRVRSTGGRDHKQNVCSPLAESFVMQTPAKRHVTQTPATPIGALSPGFCPGEPAGEPGQGEEGH